uniref:Secreted protein n=1 Tax=Anopheles coluzzii TaxID=1518534 RepID=A0A8W7Q311_ANOCL
MLPDMSGYWWMMVRGALLLLLPALPDGTLALEGYQGDWGRGGGGAFRTPPVGRRIKSGSSCTNGMPILYLAAFSRGFTIWRERVPGPSAAIPDEACAYASGLSSSSKRLLELNDLPFSFDSAMRDCCCFDSFSANAVWLRCMANGSGTATGDALLWPGDAFFEMYGSGGLSWWAKKESGCLAEGFKLLLVVVLQKQIRIVNVDGQAERLVVRSIAQQIVEELERNIVHLIAKLELRLVAERLDRHQKAAERFLQLQLPLRPERLLENVVRYAVQRKQTHRTVRVPVQAEQYVDRLFHLVQRDVLVHQHVRGQAGRVHVTLQAGSADDAHTGERSLLESAEQKRIGRGVRFAMACQLRLFAPAQPPQLNRRCMVAEKVVGQIERAGRYAVLRFAQQLHPDAGKRNVEALQLTLFVRDHYHR